MKDGPMASWPSVELGAEAPFYSSPGAQSGSAVAAVSTKIWATARRSSHPRWPRQCLDVAQLSASHGLAALVDGAPSLTKQTTTRKTQQQKNLLQKGPSWPVTSVTSRALYRFS